MKPQHLREHGGQQKHQQPHTKPERPPLPTELKFCDSMIVVSVAEVRHQNWDIPEKVTNRRTLPLREIAADGMSAYVGRLPLSEFVTLPDPKPGKENNTRRQHFTQLELTVTLPKGFNGVVLTKKFYPPPGDLNEIKGHEIGGKMIHSRRFPFQHVGKTAHSRVGTDENRNNIYVLQFTETGFVTWAIALWVDQDKGAYIVVSQPYSGDVFKDEAGKVKCPKLEAESSGKTALLLMTHVINHFADKELPAKPEGYVLEEELNLDALRRGTTPNGLEWAEAYVHEDSVARGLSFGLIKGQDGRGKKQADYLYIDWEDLPLVEGNLIRRVHRFTVVRGVVETDSAGRRWLRKVKFLPQEEMLQRLMAIRDPDNLAKGAYALEPEWLTKRKVQIGSENNLGLALAQAFEEKAAEWAKNHSEA